MTKVAVVTGGNKGIGFAIVERLATELKGWSVYLTARNPQLGLTSVKQLADKGVKVNFHQLDITSDQSIEEFAGYVKEKYGGLDILVNNAGIAFKQGTAPFAEQAEVTIKTNFFGTLNVCKHFFPLLRPHARVVHISGTLAFYGLAGMSTELRKKFVSPMTLDELVDAMNQFVSDAKAGNHRDKGWPDTCLGMSKVAVTVMTFIQQRDFSKETSREDIVVNACCPGSIATDMSDHKGQTPDQGADTPCYLAMLPPNVTSPKGEHVSRRKIQKWQ